MDIYTLGDTYQDKARRIVYEQIKEDPKLIELHPAFSLDEVLLVWFCKTLQNWKAVVITTLPGGDYYEVTYDGNKQQAYLDIYGHHDTVNNVKTYEGTSIPDQAREIVMEYFNAHVDITDNVQLLFSDTYAVWTCKTLQNWRVLVSTNVPDGMYYDVAYDGDQNIIHLTAYKKRKNITVQDGA